MFFNFDIGFSVMCCRNFEMGLALGEDEVLEEKSFSSFTLFDRIIL